MPPHPPEKRAEAKALREQGLSYAKISAAIDIPYFTVVRWTNEKQHQRSLRNAKHYKEQHRGKCEDCGKSVWLSSHLCRVCSSTRRRIWTRENIIEAIHLFNEKHGRPPVSTEWTRGASEYPNTGTVSERFGSWAAAIEAAGYQRPDVGRKLVDRSEDRAEAKRLHAEGRTVEQLADMFNMPPSIIRRYLASNERSMNPRPSGKPKKRTREQRIADLQKALAKQ